jgi:hypothetical protein
MKSTMLTSTRSGPFGDRRVHSIRRAVRLRWLSASLVVIGGGVGFGIGVGSHPLLASNPTGGSDWTAPVSGAFDDPKRWTGGVPGKNDAAQFGAVGSASPFDVLLNGSVTVGSWLVSNQAPRFVAPPTPLRPRPRFTVLGPSFLVGSGATTPSLRFEGVDLETRFPLVVGGIGLGGSLALRDATLIDYGLDVGVSVLPANQIGTLVLESEGRIERGDPTIPIRVGHWGPGILALEAGAVIELAGSELQVGRGLGGSGTLTMEPGSLLDLGGGSLVLGSVASTGVPGAAGLATIASTIRGPGSIRVGPALQGSLHFTDGATLADGVVVKVSSGGGGDFSKLTVATAMDFGTLEVAGSAEAVATGTTASVTIEDLTLGGFGSLATLAVDAGASVTVASTSFPAGGRVAVRVGDNGLGGHFTTKEWAMTPTASGEARMSVSGASSTMNMPAVALSLPRQLALLADDRGVLRIPAASISGTPLGFGGIRCEASRGGLLEVAGTLDLRAGDKSRVTVGPIPDCDGGVASGASKGGGAITAETLLTGPASVTTFVLPLGLPTAGGEAGLTGIAASHVEIGGAYAVTVADGWLPPGPVDLRLIATPSLAIGPYPTATPSFFGFPSIAMTDDEGLFLRIIDTIDGFAMPSSVQLDLGQSLTLTTMVVIDGEIVDVSGQATWSFEPPMIVERSELTRFTAMAPGVTTATVGFGSAETTIEFEVPAGPTSPFSLVSGVGLFFGNQDSGWRGPGLAVEPYGLGPRSMAADPTGTEAGRIAFMSAASNLVEGDTGTTEDVFTQDLATATILRHTGPIPGSGSPSTSWLGSNGAVVAAPALSADGRFLAGMALGTIEGVSDRRVFLVDTLTGDRAILAGLGGSGATWNSFVSRVCVSDDGRFVAFTSRATDLVAGDTNGVADVFLHDRELGTTVRVSLTPAGGQTIGANGLTDMTPDGRFVTFLRSIGFFRLAYRYDRFTGQVVTISPGLVDDTPSITVLDAQISPDGSEVLFIAQGAEPIVSIPPGGSPAIGRQLYRWSEAASLGEHPVTAITRRADGVWANAPIEGFASSRDGRFIAVATKASNLALPGPGIGDGRTRLLRLDRTAAANGPGNPTGDPAIGSHRWHHLSLVESGPFNDDVYPALAISADGTFVAFVTRATNVQPFDTAAFNDVFRCHAPIPPLGDLDGDGVVGSADLATLLGLWGSEDPSLTGGDLDGDGSVGVSDLAILLGAWSA